MQWSRAGIACLVAVLLTAGCGGGPPSRTGAIVVKAAQWPQADVLFRRDPRWLGSDGAYSLPLRDGRILWLFGDTVVEPHRLYVRTRAYLKTHAAFLRNTIAIERGSDPTTASLRFYWRSRGSHASSFFPEEGAYWYWPADAVQIDRSLIVFLDRLTTNPKRGPPDGTSRVRVGEIAVVTDDPGTRRAGASDSLRRRFASLGRSTPEKPSHALAVGSFRWRCRNATVFGRPGTWCVGRLASWR